jgi:hypothetical protein
MANTNSADAPAGFHLCRVMVRRNILPPVGSQAGIRFRPGAFGPLALPLGR